jgi:NADP-dependent 3-hydroxy acid dehydrogenase YdfG
MQPTMNEAARRLIGQVPLITGASSGLGRATMLASACAKASVVVVARSAPDLEHLLKELALPPDITREEQCMQWLIRPSNGLDGTISW